MQHDHVFGRVRGRLGASGALGRHGMPRAGVVIRLGGVPVLEP